ncbi:uncharacterized protein Y057_928 [Fusarium fujikuroi]|nr:uncharacterized protein Y057_928 [Fusarium fujikuroi]
MSANPAVATAGDFASTVRGRPRGQVDRGSTAGPMNHGLAQNKSSTCRRRHHQAQILRQVQSNPTWT